MKVKLYDSEINVMEVLWEMGDLPAKKISDILKEKIGWNMNTTYTVIKKCIEKGVIERREPGYVCHALMTREEVQLYEMDRLIDKFFGGAPESMFASLIGSRRVDAARLERIRQMIEEYDPDDSSKKDDISE